MIEKKLNDICIKVTDGTHSTVLDNTNGNYYLLSCKNVKNGKINITRNDRRIDRNTLVSLRKRTKMTTGDVILTTVGTIGESSVILDSFPNYEFQRSVAIIKPNLNYILPKYLHYYLTSLSGNNQINQMINGAAQPCLFLSNLKSLLIPCPSLVLQQHIINTIGTIDDLIEFTTKKIENLEQLGMQLYSSKINEDYRLLKVYSLNIHYGESIPKSKRQKGSIPLYASNGITDFIDGNNASKNTIIFGCRGTLGNVFFTKKKCFVLNTAFYITDVKYYGGLYFALKFNKGFVLFSSGAAQPQITIDAIKNAEVKIPTDNDLNYLLDCISINEELLNKLKKIKEILLAKHF